MCPDEFEAVASKSISNPLTALAVKADDAVRTVSTTKPFSVPSLIEPVYFKNAWTDTDPVTSVVVVDTCLAVLLKSPPLVLVVPIAVVEIVPAPDVLLALASAPPKSGGPS